MSVFKNTIEAIQQLEKQANDKGYGTLSNALNALEKIIIENGERAKEYGIKLIKAAVEHYLQKISVILANNEKLENIITKEVDDLVKALKDTVALEAKLEKTVQELDNWFKTQKQIALSQVEAFNEKLIQTLLKINAEKTNQKDINAKKDNLKSKAPEKAQEQETETENNKEKSSFDFKSIFKAIGSFFNALGTSNPQDIQSAVKGVLTAVAKVVVGLFSQIFKGIFGEQEGADKIIDEVANGLQQLIQPTTPDEPCLANKQKPLRFSAPANPLKENQKEKEEVFEINMPEKAKTDKVKP